MGAATPEDWGIASGYWNNDGRWLEAPAATMAAIQTAMGAGEGPPPEPAALVVRTGDRRAVPEAELITEDGAELRLEGRLPPDLPAGYHRLRSEAGERRLVVAPARCHLPADLFGWGLAVQLHSVLSEQSQGLGDLADLGTLRRWADDLGASFLLLNPLHSALPGLPQEPSPYYPSSRRFMNPLYLRVHDLAPISAGDLLDRDAAWTAKMAALGAIWNERRGRVAGEVEEHLARTPGLEDYAIFCVLCERLGRPWQRWPEAYRHPSGAAVRRVAQEDRPQVLFHAWLQLELDRQLAGAAGRAGLVADLAVGVHPDGADAWAFQDTLAAGMSVGAPPDAFNTAGQDWGLPPFDPWRLAAHGYEPFVQTIRAAFRHAAGIRVDHVMGLFRLFWIPAGEGPPAGTYVAYPHRELLDILALESTRAGAYVVGEDLGTVQPEVREALHERDVLSYRLLWFEPGPPDGYPREALAALTTHDLPTLAGVWRESDPMPEVRERLAGQAGLSADASPEAVLEAAYGLLARAPSRLLAATLEDICGSPDRPNRPGRLDPSNWSRPLPLSLEALTRSPAASAVARILGRRSLDPRSLD